MYVDVCVTVCIIYCPSVDLLLEISPKWTLLKEVLDEVSVDVKSNPQGKLVRMNVLNI